MSVILLTILVAVSYVENGLVTTVPAIIPQALWISLYYDFVVLDAAFS